MAATIEAGPVPASDHPRRIPLRGPARLVALLAGPDSSLTVAEAAELVAAWLEPAADVGEQPRPTRPCRCDHPIAIAEYWLGPAWARCLLCGRDVEAVIA